MKSGLTAAAVVAIMVLLTAGPASAHRVKVFAGAEGSVISGYAYYPGGGRVKGARIEAQTPDGGTEELIADENGEFTFTAKARVNHRLVVDLGDGHRAEFTVQASELPDSLPGPEGAGTVAAARQKAPPKGADAVAEGDRSELVRLVEAATAKAVRPLREEIEALRERIWIRDVIGGLGYILGLMGVYFFLAARRAARRATREAGEA